MSFNILNFFKLLNKPFWLEFTANDFFIDFYEKELAVAGVKQSIYVTFDPEEKQLVIRVLDNAGELSCALDHWCIYDEDGKLGELIDGVLVASFEGTKLQIGIADPEGNTYKVRLKK